MGPSLRLEEGSLPPRHSNSSSSTASPEGAAAWSWPSPGGGGKQCLMQDGPARHPLSLTGPPAGARGPQVKGQRPDLPVKTASQMATKNGYRARWAQGTVRARKSGTSLPIQGLRLSIPNAGDAV